MVMGQTIDRDDFSAPDFEQFALRLQQCMTALRALLARPGFGEGETSIGAELELAIVDQQGMPMPLNRRLLADAMEPRLQLEIDRFNLEYNLTPQALRERPFSRLQDELERAMAAINTAAADHGGRIATIGILPTLRKQDLGADALTDLPRYRALAAGVRHMRQAPFEININGADHLVTTSDSVTLEGANTSFQVHLRVDPKRFADTFNAAQLVTPLAVAIGSNSPLFLGHRLWDETRIALFKQAVDSRSPGAVEWRRAARVPFGHGWARHGAHELFAESVALFPPLIPQCSDEDPATALKNGATPSLSELRLHQSTTWQWNRAIFDPAGGGHLRLEMRALPAGPSAIDMAANAAFLVGLVLGMRDRITELIPALPFQYAEYNFYRSAQNGLDAQLLWPTLEPISPHERSVRGLIEEMLPVAAAGLLGQGVDKAEADSYLTLIAKRLRNEATGARWQRRTLARLERRNGRDEAIRLMMQAYLRNAATGEAVHRWKP